MEQLSLHLSTDAMGLKRFFEAALEKPVELILTDNSTRMLSFRPIGPSIAMRLSRVFLSAPQDVLLEAASFIKRRGGPTPVMNRFLRLAASTTARPRRVKARLLGRHHDLGSAFERINSEYFEGRDRCLYNMVEETARKGAPAHARQLLPVRRARCG